ncbi:MAG TPA: ethanolamine ammonia-lyase reactivating factor EutA [Candidatus Acidoferrales bacterium]|nr:ethanolamine ammonia-lyase reactivating factor EutA [Candidatus Acidoferrales bacterium]
MHDTDDVHEHLTPADFGPDAIIEDIEGLEMFTLKSVGIDIGSSTSHLVFSRLTLRREGAALSGRFKVTNREVLYRSDIMLTPYLSGTLIDIEKIKRFIEAAYDAAGLAPEDIDTGAVIITGEALKKENAQPIVEYFAKYSGRFICAAAGHNHEALLAAYGCGAVDLSKSEGKNVLNVDMGGGTTKLALIERGAVSQTAAFSVGARLIAFDDDNVVTRVEDAGRLLMKELGHTVEVGKRITQKEKEEFAALMAAVLFDILERGPTLPLSKQLMVTPPLKNYRGLDQVDCIVFSGGVSEHVYDHDRNSYGDVGPLLGKKVREYVAKLQKKDAVREPTEGIRATVIGAGEYTVQASGNTSYISDRKVLPVFGLKVVQATLRDGASVPQALRQSLRKFDLTSFAPGLALSLSLDAQLDYKTIRKVAEGIAEILRNAADTSPLYLALDLDVAKSLGGILKEELKIDREIIAIDGIEVGDLDYIDIGEPMGITEVIPVTVKSLMFPGTKLN